jgi:hypothetical protein
MRDGRAALLPTSRADPVAGTFIVPMGRAAIWRGLCPRFPSIRSARLNTPFSSMMAAETAHPRIKIKSH